MPAPAQYIIIIKDASGNLYEFNKATSIAWEHYENDVGRCRFFIPYNDLKLTATSVPDDAFSEILIYRDASLVWQGMTQIIQDVVDGVWVYGETFLAALGWYGVRYNQDHTNAAVGTIITEEYDNIETRASDFLTAKITQGTIQSPYVSGTTTNLTITRTLFNENFLTFLKQMVIVSKAEMTSSWSQNTAFGISFSDTAPTFTFTRDVGSNQADVVFELDKEIVEYNIVSDMRGVINEVKGFAIASGPQVLTKEVNDGTSRGIWYRREFYPFFNNVTAQDDLDQRTTDFLDARKDVAATSRLKLSANLKPFDGYSMGDSIKLRINRGRVNIDEFRRVVGMEVKLDDAGIEQVTPILEKSRSN